MTELEHRKGCRDETVVRTTDLALVKGIQKVYCMSCRAEMYREKATG